MAEKVLGAEWSPSGSVLSAELGRGEGAESAVNMEAGPRLPATEDVTVLL